MSSRSEAKVRRRWIRCILYCIPVLFGIALFLIGRNVGAAAHKVVRAFVEVVLAYSVALSAIMFFQEFTQSKNLPIRSLTHKGRKRQKKKDS